MIWSSAVSGWPYLLPGRRGIAPGPLLSMARLTMRRAGSARNASLTIIVLTPLTMFSGNLRNASIKYLLLLGYFYRDGGARRGPEPARAPLSRSLAVPCADRPDRNHSA